MILNDRIRLSFPWIKIKNETDEILYKLSIAEDEEEAELFLFRLYMEKDEDLTLFTPEERNEIQTLLKIINLDTKRHLEIIGKMIQEIKDMAEVAHES